MEKKKLILLLPLSLALSFHFVATKRRLSFSFFLFVVISFSSCMYTFNNRVVVFESFLFEKAHSLLNAAGRDGFSFGERKLPCGILRFTTIGAVADNFHVRRQDGVQGHGQDRTDGVRRGQ